ncbi:hypothetical protein V5O48_000012 [Marasmius crinis-equi]|uniref:WKF domain-containing protein n=1 Tax=Marasmius crinis-equi TaxID=585013 RepID=A0ABR3G281_9AGAR
MSADENHHSHSITDHQPDKVHSSKRKDKKPKKDKKKKDGAEAEEPEVPIADRAKAESSLPDEVPEEKPKKSKKSKKQKGDGLDTEVIVEENAMESTEKVKKRKSKEKGKEKEKAACDQEKTDEEKTFKKEKKKKRKRETTGDDAEDVEPPKKRSKNKTGFPDPEEDSTLSEQAQRGSSLPLCRSVDNADASPALSYAFIQFRRPKKWKFQKARQNWLIRNFWSDKSVPETHVPLVLKYLSNVQGGVRENLIKTCNSIITSKPPISEDTQTEQQKGDQEKDTTKLPDQDQETKRKRATELLHVLQQPST